MLLFFVFVSSIILYYICCDILQTKDKINLVLGEQEASQASLYDINAQLTLWQNALESRRPGKIARVDAVLEEIAEAKKKLGTRSIFSNCTFREPVQSFADCAESSTLCFSGFVPIELL